MRSLYCLKAQQSKTNRIDRLLFNIGHLRVALDTIAFTSAISEMHYQRKGMHELSLLAHLFTIKKKRKWPPEQWCLSFVGFCLLTFFSYFSRTLLPNLCRHVLTSLAVLHSNDLLSVQHTQAQFGDGFPFLQIHPVSFIFIFRNCFRNWNISYIPAFMNSLITLLFAHY